MIATQTPREPCAERAIVDALTRVPVAETVDATSIVAFASGIPGRVRPVKLIQHPSFRRAADLGPDPRFTLAGRVPYLLAQVAQAA